MYEAAPTCKHCGANLSLDDMRQTNCPYCGMAMGHHAAAAQQAQLANQVFMNQAIPQALAAYNKHAGAQAQQQFGAMGNPMHHQQLVQNHMNHANKMVKWGLIISAAVTLLIFGVVAIVLFVAL
jgi:predicted RNA-binding Zn-ribbon protein involved in translation (DUF1610 family)